MKRLATVTLLLAVAAAAMLTMGAGDEGGSYKVRAIFDNAGFIIAGEDVKVAGVKVGKIDSLDVTRDFKAVVVLDIQDPGYQDFRSDANCQVRPQSLIGEKFVECTPTQKRAVDAPAPPPLKKIDEGKGEGQYLLPVENTTKSVDLDLINNIMRLPYRQRLSLILTELGTGLAGRGTELDAGHPPRRPGAQGGRQGPRAARVAEPGARRPRARLRHGARAAGPRAQRTSPPSSRVERGRRRRPPSAAPTSRPTSSACRPSCASSSRRCAASARCRTR